MKPARIDLDIYKGSTYIKQFQWKSGNPLIPVDITGCNINMQVRPCAGSEDVIDTLTTNNNRIVIDDPIEGLFTIKFPSTITKDIANSILVYDIDIVYPGGEPTYTVVCGNIKYTNEVTLL